jgi:hypothetical protein
MVQSSKKSRVNSLADADRMLSYIAEALNWVHHSSAAARGGSPLSSEVGAIDLSCVMARTWIAQSKPITWDALEAVAMMAWTGRLDLPRKATRRARADRCPASRVGQAKSIKACLAEVVREGCKILMQTGDPSDRIRAWSDYASAVLPQIYALMGQLTRNAAKPLAA